MTYTVNQINAAVRNDVSAYISAVEAEYFSQLQTLANRFLCDKSKKILLLAGPSGSGKTTSAHILKDILKEQGISSHIISLDNFFLPLERMPRFEDGSYDFESVYSLDIAEIHTCFSELLTRGKTNIPFFDFMAGGRAQHTIPIELRAGDIAIVEGLHALNPVLSDNLPQDMLFKLYISLSAQVEDDLGNSVLTNRQMRFIRRLCRDAIYRNSLAENTLLMWPGVVRGEEQYLYPFKNAADYKLITFHAYEPCVFAKTAIELLSVVPKEHPQRQFIDQIINGLKSFEPIRHNLVPQKSLLREFIEGGKYS